MALNSLLALDVSSSTDIPVPRSPGSGSVELASAGRSAWCPRPAPTTPPCASPGGSQAGQPGGRAGGRGVRRTAGPAAADKGTAPVGPKGRRGCRAEWPLSCEHPSTLPGGTCGGRRPLRLRAHGSRRGLGCSHSVAIKEPVTFTSALSRCSFPDEGAGCFVRKVFFFVPSLIPLPRFHP